MSEIHPGLMTHQSPGHNSICLTPHLLHTCYMLESISAGFLSPRTVCLSLHDAHNTRDSHKSQVRSSAPGLGNTVTYQRQCSGPRPGPGYYYCPGLAKHKQRVTHSHLRHKATHQTLGGSNDSCETRQQVTIIMTTLASPAMV